MPKYLSDVALDASTENFYWGSRLIGALADHNFNTCMQEIDRYQEAVAVEGRKIVVEQTEIVRCRSCRHYNVACCSEGCGWCESHNVGTWDEWYCADGEAKPNAR